MTAFLTGLVLGLAGSGHCAAMCGPLVLTMGRGLKRPSQAARVGHALTYHAGRILTYVALAIPAGLAGRMLVLLGFGRIVAIAGGLVLLMAALRSFRPRLFGAAGGAWSAAATRTCIAAGRWSGAHPVAGPLLTGAANGLLPCGLVYAAVAAASAMGNTGEAVAVMSGFGAGTAPVLIALSVSAASLPLNLRLRLRRLTPLALAITAALLLLRGISAPGGSHEHSRALIPNPSSLIVNP
jgi:uncharacterized protein